MVSLDSRFAKEILNTILLEAETVEQLTSLRGSIYARIAYLKFLVALLIDADNSLIMAVVHKPCEWSISRLKDLCRYALYSSSFIFRVVDISHGKLTV